jgi:hypothetical protein
LAAVALDAELIIDWPVALDAEPLLRYGGHMIRRTSTLSI